MTISDPAYPDRRWTWDVGEQPRELLMEDGLGKEVLQALVQTFERPNYHEFSFSTDHLDLL